jgi:hypothetical protein
MEPKFEPLFDAYTIDEIDFFCCSYGLAPSGLEMLEPEEED